LITELKETFSKHINILNENYKGIQNPPKPITTHWSTLITAADIIAYILMK